MEIHKVSIDRLKQDPNNARKHPLKNIEVIKESLEQFGQQKPLVISRDYVIIAGNGTYIAAKKLGWRELAVVFSNLSKGELAAYALTDNRSSDLSEWNKEQVLKSISYMKGIGVPPRTLGWNDKDISILLQEKAAMDKKLLDSMPKSPPRLISVTFTEDQWEPIKEALGWIRVDAEDVTLSDARAIEYLAADWLAGKPGE